jgi:hypothetical protein
VTALLLAAALAACAAPPPEIAALESRAEALSLETDPEARLLAFYRQEAARPGAGPRLNRWREALPESGYAATARGFFRAETARRVRAGGEGRYQEWLGKARTDLQDGQRLLPHFPHAGQELARIEAALAKLKAPPQDAEAACAALIDLANRRKDDQALNRAMDIALNSPHYKERAAAASAVLTGYRVPESADGLARSRALIGASHPWCRYWGYQFISYLDVAQIRDADSKADLLKGLKDPDESARKSVVQALGAFEDEDLIPHVFEAFKTDPASVVRERAACSLSHTGIYTKEQRRRMLPLFIAVLEDPKQDQSTRSWAVQALNYITSAGLGSDAAKWKAWVASNR